jgi:hypothetical protein
VLFFTEKHETQPAFIIEQMNALDDNKKRALKYSRTLNKILLDFMFD